MFGTNRVVSRISARGFVFIDLLVPVPATRCARAGLAVQAHGRHSRIKSRVAGNAHLWGASVSNSLRASGACGSGAWNATLAYKVELTGMTCVLHGLLPLSLILGRLILRDTSAYIRVIGPLSLIPRDASVYIYRLCVKFSSKTHFRVSFALSCKDFAS